MSHLRTIKKLKLNDYLLYLGDKQIVPVYQYVCYASNLDLDAAQLHELYKQRSISETWIEQV